MRFERELRSRILTVTSHATLMGLEGPLPDWRRARDVALATPGVRAAVPYVESRAMLAAAAKLAGTQVQLFADFEKAVPNHVYQSIGFRLVAKHQHSLLQWFQHCSSTPGDDAPKQHE